MTGIVMTSNVSASNVDPLVIDTRNLRAADVDEPSHSLDDLLKVESTDIDTKENLIPHVPRKAFFLSFLRRGGSSKKIRSSNATLFTDIDSSANSSMLSGCLGSSTGTAHRRIPGGCLKITTQRESVGMYYGRISGHENSVNWGSMEIRSHAYCLGDNPCCIGPALSSSWEAFETVAVSVDEYEALRPGKRTKHQMILPKSLRMDVLIQSGYARGELREASERGTEIRKHRERHARLSPTERVKSLALRLRGKSSASNKIPLTHATAELSDSIRSIDFVREA